MKKPAIMLDKELDIASKDLREVITVCIQQDGKLKVYAKLADNSELIDLLPSVLKDLDSTHASRYSAGKIKAG